MNKYFVTLYALLGSIAFIAHAFFTTRAKIEINNYNKDQIIGEWILFSLVTLAFFGLVYFLYYYLFYLLKENK